MRELYLWKIAIDDIPYIKRLIELEGSSLSDIQIPLFLWELIMYLFVNENKNVSCEKFLKYLKKKYDFVNFDNLDLLIVKEFVKIKATFSGKSLGI